MADAHRDAGHCLEVYHATGNTQWQISLQSKNRYEKSTRASRTTTIIGIPPALVTGDKFKFRGSQTQGGDNEWH